MTHRSVTKSPSINEYVHFLLQQMLTNVWPSPSSKNTKLANSCLKTECYFEFESLFSQLCMMLASSLIFGQKIFDTVRNFCLKLRLEISMSNPQMTFKGLEKQAKSMI